LVLNTVLKFRHFWEVSEEKVLHHDADIKIKMQKKDPTEG